MKKGSRHESDTANGITHGWFTTIDTLRVGTITMHDVPAAILPNAGDEVLLGMQFLLQFDWQKQGGQLTLTLPSEPQN